VDLLVCSTVAALAASARAARKPGAEPPTIPAVPAEVAGIPEVARARREALAAIQDAERRARDRDARAASQARAAQFLAWARTNDGWRQWREFLADTDAAWDAREREAEDNPRRLAAVRYQRESAFAICWRPWRRAEAIAFEEREAEIMAAIPW
jgi:hypothetical protein